MPDSEMPRGEWRLTMAAVAAALIGVVIAAKAHGAGEPAMNKPETDGSLGRSSVDLADGWERSIPEIESDTPPADGWERARPGELISCLTLPEGVHSIWYRHPLEISRDWKGSLLRLHFLDSIWATDVYLDEAKVGENMGGYRPFEADLTTLAKPGAHTVYVRTWDWTACVDGPVDVSNPKPQERLPNTRAKGKVLYPLGAHFEWFGLWQPVRLDVLPRIHIGDVRIETSFRDKRLKVDVQILNDGGRAAEAVLKGEIAELDGNAVAPGKAPRFTGSPLLDIPPGGSASATLSADWPNPDLWDFESPHLYRLHLSVAAGDSSDKPDPLDVWSDRFGFREFWIEGARFFLNGVNVWLKDAATNHSPKHPRMTKDEIRTLFRGLKELGVNAYRFHPQPYPEAWHEAADEEGILVIPESGAMNRWGVGYATDGQEFWDNCAAHIEGWVKRVRNHASTVAYSVENEFVCFREPSQAKMEGIASLGRVIKKLDPGKPIMFNGDGDVQGEADIVNFHYVREMIQGTTLLPNDLRWPETGVEARTENERWVYHGDTWTWDRKKPLYMGESGWYPVATPGCSTVFFGEDTYVDYAVKRDEAKYRYWELTVPLFRELGVAGICPWTIPRPTDRLGPTQQKGVEITREILKPVTAFLREYDTEFFEGRKVRRTLIVHNDSLRPRNLKLTWFLGQALEEDSDNLAPTRHEFAMEPGAMRTVEVAFDAPFPPGIRSSPPGEFQFLWALDEGEQRFSSDSRVYRAARARSEPWPQEVAVALGDDSEIGQLRELGVNIGMAENLVKALSDPSAPLLILPSVGDEDLAPHAQSLADYVAAGGRVAIFNRKVSPFWLPRRAQIDPNHGSTIVHASSPGHPLLDGLTSQSLGFWGPDNVVATKEYQVLDEPGARPILRSGGYPGLAWSPLMELRHGRGSIILSQLQLLDKAGSSPPARRILRNLLSYLHFNALAPKTLLAAVDEKGAAHEFLQASLAEWEPADSEQGLPKESAGCVLWIECRDQAGAAWLDRAEELRAFAGQGGTILLRGLKPDSPPGDGSAFGLHFKFPQKRIEPQRALVHLADAALAGKSPARPGAPLPTWGISNHDLYWLSRGPESNPYAVIPPSPDILDRPVEIDEAGAIEWIAQGALVSVPVGLGRIVVDQTRAIEPPSGYPGAPGYLMRLLTNLGAQFAPSLLPGSVGLDALQFAWRGNPTLDSLEATITVGPQAMGGALVFSRKRDAASWKLPPLKAGEYKAVVRARGKRLGGERFQLSVDGKPVAELTLSPTPFVQAAATERTDYRDHSVRLPLPEGARELRLELLNEGPELEASIERIELRPPGVGLNLGSGG